MQIFVVSFIVIGAIRGRYITRNKNYGGVSNFKYDTVR